VAPNVVLTAAHCGEDTATGQIDNPADYAIITGNVDWTASPRQVSGVSRVVVYPSFSRTLLTGDAALLILSTPTTAPAIPLGSYPADAARLQAGTGAIIAGWGDTFPEEENFPTRLSVAETVVQGSTYCTNNSPPFYPSLEICSINAPYDDTGACHGDSGGPLIALSPVIELGVISHGEAECSTEEPTVYTRADLIQLWVSHQVAAAEPAPAPIPAPVAPGSALAPQATPVPPTPPPTEPGLYVTRPSRKRNIRIRVSGDGKHIVGLRIKMPVTCRHNNYLPLALSYLSYSDNVGISNHTAQATLEVPADRESRAGSIKLLAHFTATGSLEATLRVHIPYRSRRVGLCAGTLRFAAKI
jgi:Trypsin